jgi:APA family basic amino acid/polyamine antiporter
VFASGPLARELGPGTTLLLVVGQVIAVGIFLTPAAMVHDLVAPLWLLAVWGVMGGMAICGALVFGEFASRFPHAGGVYVYLREAWGPRLAFLYGWKCFLVMDPGLSAALAAGLSSYLPYVVPISPRGQLAVGIGVILALACVNIAGVRLGARVMAFLSIAKLGLLGVVVVAGALSPHGDWQHFVPFTTRPPDAVPLIPALAGAIVSAFFSFGGWWEAGRMAGEVKDAQRVVPRALIGGLSLVTVCYALMTALVTFAVPPDRITSSTAFVGELGTSIFGENGARLLAIIVIVSVGGSLAAFLMSAPRVYYAMADDGVFPSALARIDPRRGTPIRAILAQTALAVAILAAGRFETIVAYFVFITVVFLIIAVAGIYRIRSREAAALQYRGTAALQGGSTAAPSARLFRLPGYPLTPIGFLVPAVAVVALVAASNPLQSIAGACAVATGLVVWPRLGAGRDPQRPAAHPPFRETPPHDLDQDHPVR